MSVSRSVGLIGGLVSVALLGGRSAAQEESPQHVTNGFVTVEGARIYYETAGEGRPVVLIHGGMADRRVWDSQFATLARHYRVVRYDVPGLGKSQAPTNEFSQTALLRKLLESLGIGRAHLLGNSLGSVIATEFALDHPEMTTALVLTGPAVNGFQASQESMQRGYALDEILRNQGAQQAAEAILADPVSAPAMENPAARDRLRQITLENAARFHRNVLETWASPPAAHRLNEIRCPTLIVLGSRDIPDSCAMASIMEIEIAAAEKVVVNGAGHLVQMEQPDEFNRLVLDFLGRQPGPELANLPHPPSGARAVRSDPTLIWAAGDEAAAHDVYFGADSNVVTRAGRNDDPAHVLVSRNQSPTAFVPGFLDFNTTYFWRVDEISGSHIRKGPVWKFTTGAHVVVDDFEVYNNASPDRVFQTWLDGAGFGSDTHFPTGFDGNQTQAVVGHVVRGESRPDRPDRRMEHNIVHSGRQALPLYFDNSKPPFTSRTDRVFPMPQDWSRNGVEYLTIWVRGMPPLLGGHSQGLETGIFTVRGAGADIWGTADQFHYVWKKLSGDGSIQAKVLGLANTDDAAATHSWAKTGIMVRDTLTTDSASAVVFVTRGEGCHFEGRRFAGAAAIADSWGENDVDTDEQQTLQPPYWIKLQRTGDAFNGYYSADGSNWTRMSWSPQTIPMKRDVHIGLALTSHAADVQCQAEFSNLTVRGINDGAVTGDWQSQDIGIESNDKEPMYAVIRDSEHRTATVMHPDPNAVVTPDWRVWTINLAEQVAAAGVDLRKIAQLSVGIGDPKATSPGGRGRVLIDEIMNSKPPPEPKSVKNVLQLDGSPGPAWSLGWSPDGNMLASAGFGQVTLWNAQTGAALATFKGHANDVWGVAWSPDGSKIASCGVDGAVRLWDANTHEAAASFNAGKWTLCVTWSPDGSRLASGTIDGDVEIRDAETGNVMHRLTGAQGHSVISVAWSPDGRVLATGQWNGVIYLWNAETGAQLYSLTSNASERHDVNGLAWSPDGSHLASAHQDGKIRLWRLGTANALEQIEGHAGAARGLAWSADGRLLASTGTDSAVRLWDVETGRQLADLEGVSFWALCVAWSPDGKRIAAGNGKYGERVGGTVMIWAAP